LVISEEDLRKAIKIIGESLAELDEVGSIPVLGMARCVRVHIRASVSGELD
jgi:hypothetical protein